MDVSRGGSVKSSQNVEQGSLSAAAGAYDRNHAARFDFEIDPAQGLHFDSSELVCFDKGIHYDWDGGHADLTVLLTFERSCRAAVIAGRKTPRDNRPIIAKMFSDAHNGKMTLRGASRLE